jgi:hypothetical protein
MRYIERDLDEDEYCFVFLDASIFLWNSDVSFLCIVLIETQESSASSERVCLWRG